MCPQPRSHSSARSLSQVKPPLLVPPEVSRAHPLSLPVAVLLVWSRGSLWSPPRSCGSCPSSVRCTLAVHPPPQGENTLHPPVSRRKLESVCAPPSPPSPARPVSSPSPWAHRADLVSVPQSAIRFPFPPSFSRFCGLVFFLQFSLEIPFCQVEATPLHPAVSLLVPHPPTIWHMADA